MRAGSSLILACGVACAAYRTAAAPLPPMNPVDIRGRIVRLQWVPERHVKGVPGMSGSAGRNRVMPAHFRVVLEHVEGTDAETLDRISAWVRPPDEQVPECKDPPCATLKIEHPDPHFLSVGMRIAVWGYCVRGDEGGTWTRFDRLEIFDGE